jgi:transposase
MFFDQEVRSSGDLVPRVAVTRRYDLTDAQWAVLEPLLPRPNKLGRPSKWSRRQLVDGVRWRIRVGAPWRDVPECYGHWRSVYGLYRQWQRDGTWARILTALQSRTDTLGLIGWDVSVDSTVVRAHQHAAGARRHSHAQVEPPGGDGGLEPDDHALGRSRGGLSTKLHLACEQHRQAVALTLTGGQRGDSPQFTTVLERIRVPRAGAGRPARARTGCWPTRPTAAAPTGPTYANAASAAPSRSSRTLRHPGQAGPGHPPPQPRLTRRAATVLRPIRLPPASRRRMRHQPAQTAPRPGHPLRQTRRPLRSHRHHQHDRHLAPPEGWEQPRQRRPLARAWEQRFHSRFSYRLSRVFVRKIKVELRGLEPLTPSLRTRCATSCATAPGHHPAEPTGPATTLAEYANNAAGWRAPERAIRRDYDRGDIVSPPGAGEDPPQDGTRPTAERHRRRRPGAATHAAPPSAAPPPAAPPPVAHAPAVPPPVLRRVPPRAPPQPGAAAGPATRGCANAPRTPPATWR